jgi:hypothetical protein
MLLKYLEGHVELNINSSKPGGVGRKLKSPISSPFAAACYQAISTTVYHSQCSVNGSFKKWMGFSLKVESKR